MDRPPPHRGARRPLRAAIAALAVGLVGACAPTAIGSTTPSSASPSAAAAVAPSAFASDTSAPLQSPTSSPPSVDGPAGSSAPLTIVANASLAALLPSEADGIRLVRRDLADGGPAPAPFDTATLQLVRDLAATPTAAVSLGWIEPEAGPVDRTGGVRAVALEIAGADGPSVRRAVVLAALLRPGRTGIEARRIGDKDAVILGETAAIWTRDRTLIAMSWPAELVAPPSSGPRPTAPQLSFNQFFVRLPASDPAPSPSRGPEPTPTLPTLHPNASLAPDREIEALLPATVGGHSLSVLSGSGPDILTNQLLGIPTYALLRAGLDIDLTRAGAAIGYAKGLSSYVVIATRVPDARRLDILWAWFRLVGETRGTAIEVVDVDGRTVQIYGDGSQAVFVADGLIYLMMYFDAGDFPPASPPPRPALRDLVVDTIRNLPPAADDGSRRP
jgi:hypothetical protein